MINISSTLWPLYATRPSEFVQLLCRMRDCTLNTGICFNDLDPSNMGMIDGTCYYFDLDGVWRLEDFIESLEDWRKALFYLAPHFDP